MSNDLQVVVTELRTSANLLIASQGWRKFPKSDARQRYENGVLSTILREGKLETMKHRATGKVVHLLSNKRKGSFVFCEGASLGSTFMSAKELRSLPVELKLSAV